MEIWETVDATAAAVETWQGAMRRKRCTRMVTTG